MWINFSYPSAGVLIHTALRATEKSPLVTREVSTNVPWSHQRQVVTHSTTQTVSHEVLVHAYAGYPESPQQSSNFISLLGKTSPSCSMALTQG